MHKCLILYYSDSGTTFRVAKQIAEGIGNYPFEISLFNMADGYHYDLKQYDLIGIGSPVYFFHPPFAVRRYLRTLPKLAGKFAFRFATFGTNLGKTLDDLLKLVEEKGMNDLGAIACRNANFILGFRKKGDTFTLDQVREEDLKLALEFGSKIGKEYLHLSRKNNQTM